MDEEEQNQNPADEEGEDEELSAQDPVEGGGRNHISVLEAMFALLICIGVDLLEIFLSAVGIAWLLTPVDVGVWALLTILFAMKGGYSGNFLKKRFVKQFGAFILELVPVVETLPIRTVVVAWSIFSWNKELDVKIEERIDQMGRFEKIGARAAEKFLGQFD